METDAFMRVEPRITRLFFEAGFAFFEIRVHEVSQQEDVNEFYPVCQRRNRNH